MPTRPLRQCCYPGCAALVRGGYCAQHQRVRPPQPDSRSPESRAWHSWYNLPVWTERLRPGQLLREPFCRVCAGYGLRTPATDVDHVEPFAGDWQKFIDPNNLQSLCHSCHSRKTARETREKIWRKIR